MPLFQREKGYNEEGGRARLQFKTQTAESTHFRVGREGGKEMGVVYKFTANPLSA